MDRRHEGFFEGHDGLNLFFQVWEASSSRGTILITHGQAEHSESYHRLVDFFRGSGWSVWAWDLRGHGRSEGKRGYAASFEDYVEDAEIFYHQVFADERVKGKPLIALGHSMGALIQLKSMILHPQFTFSAQVCSAPFLGLNFQPPAWKEKGAALLNRVYPEITLWNEIRHQQLTRDPVVIREFEQDVLRHDRISPGVYLGFQPAFDFVNAHAHKITLPTLFQIPEEDPIVDSRISRAFFERLGSSEKKLLSYGEGARHEMYNDLHRQQVMTDLQQYLHPFLEAQK